MKKQQAQPEFTTDADGQRLAHIALANTDQRATLYAEDYQRLIDAGFSAHWSVTGMGSHGRSYPTLYAYTVRGDNRPLTVARLITNAPQGQRAEPRDGNALNMRTENLQLVAGVARFAATDWYPTATAARAAGVALEGDDLCTCTAPHPERTQTTARSKPHCRPVRPTVTAGRLQAPHEPAREYTPHVRDTAATSARVRAMLAAGTP